MSSPSRLRRGVTCTFLNYCRKQPSLKDKFTKYVINSAKMAGHALTSDVGTYVIGEDLDVIDEIIL